MSIALMTRVWQESQAEGSALLLLLAIADHAHDDGTGAWPSVETLGAKTRQTRRNVQLLLRKLEELGELKTELGGGPHGCNAYSVHLGGVKITQVKASARGAKSSAEDARQISPEPSLEPSFESSGSISTSGEKSNNSQEAIPLPTGLNETFPESAQLVFPELAGSPEFSAVYRTIEEELGQMRPANARLVQDLWEENPYLDAHHHAYLETKAHASFFNLKYYEVCLVQYVAQHPEVKKNGRSNGSSETRTGPERDGARSREERACRSESGAGTRRA